MGQPPLRSGGQGQGQGDLGSPGGHPRLPLPRQLLTKVWICLCLRAHGTSPGVLIRSLASRDKVTIQECFMQAITPSRSVTALCPGCFLPWGRTSCSQTPPAHVFQALAAATAAFKVLGDGDQVGGVPRVTKALRAASLGCSGSLPIPVEPATAGTTPFMSR